MNCFRIFWMNNVIDLMFNSLLLHDPRKIHLNDSVGLHFPSLKTIYTLKNNLLD